jgi:hypothetical protein
VRSDPDCLDGIVGTHVGPLALDGLMVISGFALLAMSSSPIANAPARRVANLGRQGYRPGAVTVLCAGGGSAGAAHHQPGDLPAAI